MSYDIERLNNVAAYLVTFHEDFSMKDEMLPYYEELINALNSEAIPISIILDVRKYAMSFDDMISGTNDTIKSANNPYQHHNAKKLVFLTDSNLLKLSIKGLIQFGLAKQIKIAESIEDAYRLAQF